MLNQILLYAAAAFITLWGIAHLFPTRDVVKGFGNISPDNRNIITMEWIIEGMALIFTGVVLVLVTIIDPSHATSKAVYGASVFMLAALAVVSLFTGYKVNFLPFKLCPLIFTIATGLIALGMCL